MRDAWPRLARAPRSTRAVAAGSVLVAFVAVGLLAAPRAEAQGLGRRLGDPTGAAPSESGWAFDLAAVTSLPLAVGAEATLTTPVGLFAQLSVGHTPQAYLGVIAGALADADAFDDEVDVLVSDAIANGAWNVRAGLGFTIPAGLELSAGYTWLHAGTALSPAGIEAAIGQRVRWPGMTTVPLSLTIHALYGRLGWRFLVADHLVIRAAIGWTHAVGSEARVDVPSEIRDRPNDPATRMEEALVDGIGRYGFTPEIVLSAGYRF